MRMFWRRKKSIPATRIIIGQADTKTSNHVSTTKYNAFSFLPLFLFYQFKTFGNLFFLVICIVQFIPSINPYGANTTIIPLVTIILAAAAKEVYEDFGRLVADRRVNRQLVLTCVQDEKATGWNWDRIHWAKLKVGQIVKVMKNEALPADLVLLSSSEPAGMAYIETSNLDGETNLKIRQALPVTAWMIDDDTAVSLCSSGTEVECDPPSSALYEFRGVIKNSHAFKMLRKEKSTSVTKSGGDKEEYPLGTNQLLPRGSKLQNTDWIYGVTVYTGVHTKLMLNTARTRTKISLVERITNCLMMIQFGFLVFMAVFNACMGCYSISKIHYYMPYFHGKFRRLHIGPALVGLIIFYSGLIPISLNITLEMIQLFQAYFIKQPVHFIQLKLTYHVETF